MEKNLILLLAALASLTACAAEEPALLGQGDQRVACFVAGGAV